MSAIETLEDALLAKVEARITSATTQRGAISIDDIPATSLPFAFTASPSISSESLDFEQRVRRTGINVVIVCERPRDASYSGNTRATLLNDMEAIETSLEETDPTLAGTVQAVRLESMFVDENPDSGVYVGVMGIIVEEWR